MKQRNKYTYASQLESSNRLAPFIEDTTQVYPYIKYQIERTYSDKSNNMMIELTHQLYLVWGIECSVN